MGKNIAHTLYYLCKQICEGMLKNISLIYSLYGKIFVPLHP